MLSEIKPIAAMMAVFFDWFRGKAQRKRPVRVSDKGTKAFQNDSFSGNGERFLGKLSLGFGVLCIG